LIFKTKDGFSLYKKQRPQIGDIPTKKPKSVFYKPEYSSGNGTAQLKKIFDKKVFNNPKPIDLIEDFLSLGGDKEGIFLDFFAGTGTMGHAVMKLNEKDNGKRQFILCTNNENNICLEVTLPRIKKAIKGYKTYNPLGNSLRYYKTEFIGKNNILEASDEDKVELAHNAGELLAIAENTLELIKKNKYYQLFQDNLKEKYTAVYFREELDQFDKFVEVIKKLNKETTVYVFSWGTDEFVDDFDGLKNIKIKTIPVPILEIYKNIYNLGN
jgi:adenine-specific DNA-methyltransferase